MSRAAARKIIAELDSKAAVDVYLADQLIPFMGLAGGESFTVREVYWKTNIWVIERFLGVELGGEGSGGWFVLDFSVIFS